MEWKQFDKDYITKTHGDMYKYRDLYQYRHAKHSRRATELIEKGEIIDLIEKGQKAAKNVRTPYLMLNISKIICDVPAYFVSGSIGDIISNHTDIRMAPVDEDEEILESAEDDTEMVDLQQVLINQIVRNSQLKRKHKSNIIQHQVDGGIVGVPIMQHGQISIQFKERNVYYPHEDGLGCDLVYEMDKKDDAGNDYVHVYTERQEYSASLKRSSLDTYHRLYKRKAVGGELEEVTDVAIIKDVLRIDKLKNEYKGRQRTFIEYWGNDANFMNPLGISALAGQEGKQEEINWTLTRAGITFERNGKPRISVTSEVMDRLMQLAEDRHGDPSKIDHRDLEITEMDEHGNAIQNHQIDVDKIGDMKYVKDLVKGMLAETSTSEKAMDFLNDGTGSAAQSGVAKFYDLLSSIIKAQQLQGEYVEFLQGLFESALWLANNVDSDVIIERPDIVLNDMIPVPKGERDDNAVNKKDLGAQSLKQTVRELHPNKSDAWVDDEVLQIQSEANNADTMAMSRGQQTLQGFFNNRDADGAPLNEDGTRREEE